MGGKRGFFSQHIYQVWPLTACVLQHRPYPTHTVHQRLLSSVLQNFLPYLWHCEVVDLNVLHDFIQQSVSHRLKVSKRVILVRRRASDENMFGVLSTRTHFVLFLFFCSLKFQLCANRFLAHKKRKAFSASGFCVCILQHFYDLIFYVATFLWLKFESRGGLTAVITKLVPVLTIPAGLLILADQCASTLILHRMRGNFQ